MGVLQPVSGQVSTAKQEALFQLRLVLATFKDRSLAVDILNGQTLYHSFDLVGGLMNPAHICKILGAEAGMICRISDGSELP